ncbi:MULTISPECIES: FAD-binding protein [unclassified Sphingomonas]|uniref:FAD-binding protein n=1 Tax=unclassified Sphingomonas TaxID=196159 RepID=UPI0021511FDE|nr:MULTISPECIES: FAD-binding protein [unclassified Sphingomonas]MCR5869465.1 FAD-binding protein [Sphingomonas sp. J344]UUX98805.1 FAD-binding protein [Sphingomonas sp. J315]
MIRYQHDVEWQNLHLTIGDRLNSHGAPYYLVAEQASLDVGYDLGNGLRRFARDAKRFFAHLEYLLEKPDGPQVDAGLFGAAWSFAPLIGNPVRAFDCSTLHSVAIADPSDVIGSDIPAGRIIFAGGGTTLDQLTAFSEARGLTIKTSGSFLHSTLAGSIGTASHGSRLHYGGIQNMVRGMHFAVAPGKHYWIERASAPLLSTEGLICLSEAGAEIVVIRDDMRFEDALIHLGAMGVLIGLALELEPSQQFAVLRMSKAIDDAWMRSIESGDFNKLARNMGVSADPIFYELTLDPHAVFRSPALHTCYFVSARESALGDTGAGGGVAHFLAGAAARTLSPAKNSLGPTVAEAEKRSIAIGAAVAPDKSQTEAALRFMMRGSKSAFEAYRIDRGFQDDIGDFDPADLNTPSGTWRSLHDGIITSGKPGALYNASYAISRERTGEALEAIAKAVQALPATFLLTLRFVSEPAGTLAFTRFRENSVIEVDGASPLYSLWAAAIAQQQGEAPELINAIRALSNATADAALAVRQALSAARIDYSMHWAKLGELDAAKVHADFGSPEADDSSLIHRWRATRDFLVPKETRHLFTSQAVRHYRLV